MKDRNSKLVRRITYDDIVRMRNKYLNKKKTGYDYDKKTGAIIVYAISGPALTTN